MTNRKRLFILAGLIAVGIISYLAWKYYKTKYSDGIDRDSNSYRKSYKRTQDSLSTNGIDFRYPPLSDKYGAPTVELILAKEYGFRYLHFGCIVDDINRDAGLAEGYQNFIAMRYGKDFIENATSKAEVIDKKFNVQFYVDSLEAIANRHFKKRWTSDSTEVGEFNFDWTCDLPFTLIFDSVFNKNYSIFYWENNSLHFAANSPYSDEKVKTLPVIVFTAYWKKESEYPYKDIPFSRIHLNRSE